VLEPGDEQLRAIVRTLRVGFGTSTEATAREALVIQTLADALQLDSKITRLQQYVRWMVFVIFFVQLRIAMRSSALVSTSPYNHQPNETKRHQSPSAGQRPSTLSTGHTSTDPGFPAVGESESADTPKLLAKKGLPTPSRSRLAPRRAEASFTYEALLRRRAPLPWRHRRRRPFRHRGLRRRRRRAVQAEATSSRRCQGFSAPRRPCGVYLARSSSTSPRPPSNT
jgi:hypothetical protein